MTFENCKISPSSSSDALVYGMAIEIITLSFLMPWKLHEWSLTLYQRSILISEKRIHIILLSLDSWFLAYLFVTLGVNGLCTLTSSFPGTAFSSCHIVVISNLKNNNEMLTRGTIWCIPVQLWERLSRCDIPNIKAHQLFSHLWDQQSASTQLVFTVRAKHRSIWTYLKTLFHCLLEVGSSEGNQKMIWFLF